MSAPSCVERVTPSLLGSGFPVLPLDTPEFCPNLALTLFHCCPFLSPRAASRFWTSFGVFEKEPVSLGLWLAHG